MQTAGATFRTSPPPKKKAPEQSPTAPAIARAAAAQADNKWAAHRLDRLTDALAQGIAQRDPIIRAAAHNGKSCAHCRRQLHKDEPVWRQRTILGRGLFGWRIVVAPFCEQCKSKYRDFCSARPCASCGRPVHNSERRSHRQRTYCSDECRRRHQSNYQAAIARQCRAEARGPSRACVECREHFEPTRADAQFCSARCKQKAYRKRVTVTKDVPWVTFGSRNAVGTPIRHAALASLDPITDNERGRSENACGPSRRTKRLAIAK